jgi:hypothetical protein
MSAEATSLDERQRIIALIEEHLAAYPEDIFSDLGKTPDAIAAKAIRWKLSQILSEIRDGR